jgi:sugar lactone lactonase YvrE
MYVLVSSAYAAILCVSSWFSSRPFRLISSTNVAIALWLAMGVVASAQSKVATTTALAVTTSAGSSTSVPTGTVVTLTATVTPASGAIKTGQVNFCDASATYCTDIHLIGTAQLTNAGTATVKLRPGIGSHSYKAVFLGTTSDATSSSSSATLTVTGTTGPNASTSTIAESGSWGSYALTATVTGIGSTIAPTGNVSFLDTTNSNSVLTSATLGTSVPGIAWPNPKSLTPAPGLRSLVAGDFNGDGIPDLAVNAGNELTVLLGNADGTYTTLPSITSLPGPPVAVVMGDFNSDGHQDLAVTIYSSGAIAILLGNGDGTFTLTSAGPTVGIDVAQIGVGEFNGDGIPDLALISDLTGAVNILLGNGDGTFTAASANPAISGSAQYFATGDFNGDGKMDLAVTGSGDEVSILLGNGDGTFGAVTTIHCGSNGAPVVAGDFNGDGKLDLAVGIGGISGNNDGVSVLAGNGNGTFNPPSSVQTATDTTATSIQVGDFNRDGHPDVVLTDSNGNTIVFLNNGSGTLSKSFPVVAISPAYFLVAAVGDLNGDGYTDIVAGGYYNGSFSVLLTEPTETATATADIAVSGTGVHLVDASYGGDANNKVSVSGTIPLWGVPPTTTTTLTVTSGGSTVTSVSAGSVVALTATVSAGATPITAGQVNFCDASTSHCTGVGLLATAQLTSNGTAVFKFVPPSGQHSYKAVFVEDGWGMSSASNVANLTVGSAGAPNYTDTTSITAAGFPGNYSLAATVEGFGGTATPTGTVSFLDSSSGNAAIGTATLGSGTPGMGWLISQTPAAAGNAISEVAADFNGDGIPDIALLWTSDTYSEGPFSVTIFFGNGDGTFTTGPTTQVGLANFEGPTMIGADFNGDGKADLVVLSGWGYPASCVVALLGNGDGTFAPPITSTGLDQGAQGGDVVGGSVVAADLNGDGKMDLAVVGDCVAPCSVTILLGNGDGTFTASAINTEPTESFNVIAAGDFNGDGIPDLVAANYFSPSGATVFLGKGDGTFQANATLDTNTFESSIVVADFNGDGVLDLAFGNTDFNDVLVFLGNGDGTFTQSAQSPISGAGLSLVAGDFNHDGRVDLAGIDNYNDQIDLFVGAGDGTFTEIVTTPNISQNPIGPFAIVAADFNKDGVPDLAMLTKYVDTASILLTEPTETATATINGIVPLGGGTHNVEASYEGDGNFSPGVSGTITLTSGLAPLVITPAPGPYFSGQTITLSESVPGATIYYEGSGTVNTNGYVPYKGPIALTHGGSEVIQAYATENGYLQSNYLTASYTLVLPPEAAPAISPAAGYYGGAQTVTITDTDSAAQIYYTTNGTIPTSSSNLYTGPIKVSSSETVVASAISNGHSFSQPVSAQYAIGSSSVAMIYSVAGSGTLGYAGDGGPATLAELDGVYAVAKDASGNLYFSDESNHMVRKVAAGTGVITAIAGNGYSGYSGDGGQATSAELIEPTGLALDNAGNLFIVDSGNSTIRELNLSSGIISTYAGNPTATASGDGGPATAAALGYVTGIVFDASGDLYLTSGSTIREVNATGIINTVAGSSYGYGGDGAAAINAVFAEPSGLAFDASGNLYIADFTSSLIRKITATHGVINSSSIVSTVAGTPPPSSAPFQAVTGYSGDGGPATGAKLNYPSAVALDKAGNLYISDEYNGVIREVSASSGIISTVVGNGANCGALGGDGGAATSASLCYAVGITVDGSGNLFIADNWERIREVTASAAPPATQAAAPTFSVAAGTYATAQSVTISDTTPGASIYVTVDGTTPTTSSSGYSLPISVTGTVTLKAVAVAPGYLTSAPVSASYTITAKSPLITTYAGNGTSGFYGAGQPALDMMFSGPSGVAIDKAGNLYVSDPPNNVVWKITASSGTASIFAGNGNPAYTGDGGAAVDATLFYPEGLALDSAGNLYIADNRNNVIRTVAAGTGKISTFAGGGYQTYPPNGVGDGGPAISANLMSPSAVAVDTSGNVYIADTYNERIREVIAITGIISTVAGNGTYGNSGDGGAATSASLVPPDSVAVDKAGNIYIGSAYGARIRKVTAASGTISTVAGFKDLPGETGDGAQANAAEVAPHALALDSSGNLYFSNTPAEIRAINAATGAVSRVAGIGFSGYSGDGGAATAAQLLYPAQIAFDSAGNLYFADGSYRIRKVTFNAQATATPTFSVAGGTYTVPQSVAITDATPGAAIYYTTDGSTPTASSSVYSAAIAVNSSETIKTFAEAIGSSPSTVASATYVLNLAAPTPSISSFSPAFTGAGGAQFTVTVNGSEFTNASTVYWGASALTTQYASSTQLTATVPAADVAAVGIGAISVQTPAPGGGTSNSMQFEIDSAGAVTPPSFSPTTVTVNASAAATYAATLPSSATGVSVNCLNLPVGAACSYSTSTGTLTITTTSATPAGTYLITVVFAETLPGAASALILLPFLLVPIARMNWRNDKKACLLVFAGVLAALTIVAGCGGGGGNGGGGSNPPQATHQVTSSGTVTLIVK